MSRSSAALESILSMKELLRRIAVDKDQSAFQELYCELGPRLKSYMMKQGSNEAAAEDLVQETMITIWRKAQLFEHKKGAVTSWAFTIARNLRIDRFRKEKAWQEISDERTDQSSDDMAADDLVAQNEVVNRIRQTLQDLPDLQRNIIELSYIDGLSQGAISEKIGLPLGTVKSRMRLAYKRMRSSVEDLK